MSTFTLSPPLESIRQRLFGLPDAYLLALAEDRPDIPESIRAAAMNDTIIVERVMAMRATLAQTETSLVSGAPLPQPPDFIKALIAEKVAARSTYSELTPTPGLIVQTDRLFQPDGKIVDLVFASPFAMLLDRQDESQRCWHGWLVAPDLQYASYWDFVLQEVDAPFDPVCALVQLWNPVQIHLPKNFTSAVLGRLNPERLQALRAMAVEYVQGGADKPSPRPGHIAMRSTYQGYQVVTGTPLGDENDPRYAYQLDYHHAAQVLNAPVRAWLSQSVASFANWFSAVVERLREAWHESTGDWVQAQPAVANAMTAEDDNTHQVLELASDLRLELVCRDDDLNVIVTYLGDETLKVRFLEQGETAKVATLTANFRSLAYAIDDSGESHHLHIERADGEVIELPLSVE